VKVVSNISTLVLGVIRGDDMETHFLEIQQGKPAPEGYKYRDVAFQVEGVSNLREKNPENICAGEDKQQF
jgi:hypothetical protein